jgi:peptidyl-prolyl cis-trans isomerase SDCCAG10
VVLKTSFGDIEVELWSREAPKACRNFVQLCLEGYYDGVLFHRIVKGFIAQGGDPTGTGAGGESIYGHPFKVMPLFQFLLCIHVVLFLLIMILFLLG